MIISREQMQLIVEELESSIHRHVNIMDTDGHIIASTDTARIGTVHGAARKLLMEQLERLDICFDNEYEGSRQGINMPVTFHGETVGVVGITGEPRDVEDLGMILKKMTEILIEEAYRKDQEMLYRNARSAFLYRWLSEEETDGQETDRLEQDGHILGIDTRLPRIAAVLEPNPADGDDKDVILQQQIQTGLADIVSGITSAHPDHIHIPSGSRLLLLCHSTQPKAVELLCKQIYDAFISRYHVPLAIGIGSPGTSRQMITRSYREAERACYLSLHTRGNELHHFSDSDFRLLLEELSEGVKSCYVNQIFSACPADELEQWMLMLRVFFDTNGSIGEASRQLFIHKNTLQYRLNKLKQMTGYDPRVYSEAFSLYTALTIYERDTGRNLFDNAPFL